MIELRRTWHTCDGDGIVEVSGPGEDYTCPICGGSGKLDGVVDVPLLATFLDDLSDRVNDVLDKCSDILEAVQTP